MKKRIFSLALILVLVLPLLVFCGCGTKSVDYKEYDEQRFIFVGSYKEIETPVGNSLKIHILVDKETKIMYIYTDTNGGITPLLNNRGEVTYYKGSLNEIEQWI